MAEAKPEIEILFASADIAKRNEELAEEIASTMGSDILVIAVLKGSFVFAADLIRALHHAGVNPQIDFMALSSYGDKTVSSGNVVITRDIVDTVKGRKVLLIDDILESGRTMAFATKELLSRGAETVKTCLMLDKKGKRVSDFEADFIGFDCPDLFVVGYGLDFAHYYRELPYIGHIIKH
ncbi:MAG: hypoxanthine phosphoribosyltransferase [Sneathiella sp.]|uniref:hypoxanthine phosphoribosyltransferase n=1 Tax=Sneathiella sp. TaxID=1964365 RepID=UPI000C510633|nr:hypoxanthine phosphoribosyltransferase [Sneathiella sp.]MAZ03545.1 hypoxanthine phosphoribosyltransferase [Sneathiella sp.]|tara:strand:+ start:442 stop:981 length:540 start_codon:yes stop_codon:yes gene_type:complete